MSSIGTLLLFASLSPLSLIILRYDHPDAGVLGGRVKYVEGEAIAGATVSAYNVFTRETKRVKTDEKGLYEFTGMRQGRYNVFLKAEGYCERWIFAVFIVRGERTHLDLTLTGKTPKGSGCVEISGPGG